MATVGEIFENVELGERVQVNIVGQQYFTGQLTSKENWVVVFDGTTAWRMNKDANVKHFGVCKQVIGEDGMLFRNIHLM